MPANTLLNQFEADIITSFSIPYCQVQNPPNLSLAQIQDLNLPWGWFIPQEQAELAEFIPPSEIWTPTALSFGEDSGHPRTIAGFLARKIKIVVLHTSNIEVQEKTTKGWKYSGLAYKLGNLTSFGQLAKKDREHYRYRNRYLIFFVNEKQELLHASPIKIGRTYARAIFREGFCSC